MENEKKLKELILYICFKSETDESFGATKLNKILFYADFLAYIRLGKAITGEEYVALSQGPAPKNLIPIREELVNEKRLAIRKRDYYGKNQQKPIALDAPDLSLFSPTEIAFIDDLIEKVRDMNATEISNLSHSFMGWRLAEEGEQIPYEVALVGSRHVTERDSEIAQMLEPVAQKYIS